VRREEEKREKKEGEKREIVHTRSRETRKREGGAERDFLVAEWNTPGYRGKCRPCLSVGSGEWASATKKARDFQLGFLRDGERGQESKKQLAS